MFRRFLPEDLIAALVRSPLWKNVVADRDLAPEVRDGHVTVYFRGGALLQGLRLEGGKLAAEVHPKYVPVAAGPAPVRMVQSGDGLSFAHELTPLPPGTCGPDVLAAYKGRMAQVLLKRPEGDVVQKIVAHAENQILDQELAFQESGEPRDKVDVCHFDATLGKLAFVEVKRVDDDRLFRPAGRPEVLDQLADYGGRLMAHRADILRVYRDVARWKRELGLGGRLARVPPEGPSDLLTKPLLVIGNCSAADVRAIRAGADEWKPLVEGLPDVSAGLILCGRDGCRLDLVPGRQTIVF